MELWSGNINTYNAVVSVSEKAGQCLRALELLVELAHVRLQLGIIMHNLVACACRKGGRLFRAALHCMGVCTGTPPLTMRRSVLV